MGSYKRKDGTTVSTTAVYNKALNKRGISKLVHIVPAQPAFKSPEFAMTLATLFGTKLLACMAKKSGSTDRSRPDSAAKECNDQVAQASD